LAGAEIEKRETKMMSTATRTSTCEVRYPFWIELYRVSFSKFNATN
jgi:hypothetical protein